MWVTTLIIGLVGTISVIWIWSKKTFCQFRKHGIPEAKAWFPFGSSPMWNMITGTPFTMIFNDLYQAQSDFGKFGNMRKFDCPSFPVVCRPMF